MRRALVIVAMLAVVLSLGGCTARATAPAPKPAAVGNPDSVQLMTSRTGFPAGFPLEIPVPSGMLANAEAQGRSAWDYEMVVPAPPIDVAAWYLKMYQGREWVVTKNALAADGTGTLMLQKGIGAQSKVKLAADGNQTHATVSIGIGVPVNSTY